MKHDEAKIQELIEAQPAVDVITAYAEHVNAKLIKRVADLEAALLKCHDALQLEQCQHAPGDFIFTMHPLLREQGKDNEPA